MVLNGGLGTIQDQDQVSQDQDLQKVVLNGLKTKTWS